MQKLKLLLLLTASAVLTACGGGSDNTLVAPPGTGPGGPVVVSSLTLLTSSPQIPSDGGTGATITALVRDNHNNVMADVPVTFSANSGSLVVTQPAKTDANGVLTAQLSAAGDKTNRAITVAGLAGERSANVVVNVTGTTLSLNGPASLPLGSTGAYNVVLLDAGSAAIGNQSVTVTSSRNNGISQTPIFTDSTGKASFTLTATNGGSDTVTVSALGIQAPQTVAVSSDAFVFTTPDAGTEVTLGSNVVVTVNWKQGNAAVANAPINFSSTRGTVSAATANTDGAGDATITIAANNAGPAVITATTTDGTSTQRTIEFVATTPTTLELQADPFTVPTNDHSAITAIVRDANGNLVKNQFVNFTLTDTTGGSLAVAQAKTDSQGRAQTSYNSSTTTSAVDGVRVNATVQGTAVTDFVNLTVAQREVFISLGTGNEIDEFNTAQYRKEWIVQVTDALGNGVNKVDLTVSVLSVRYWDGIREFVDPPGVWATEPGLQALPLAGCPDEDGNRNGVLNTGEDSNTSGRLEAGNIVTVAPHAGTGGKITTDANGFALVDLFYPQEYAYWVEVTLEARTSVQGTEFKRSSTFVLPGSTIDFASEDTAPPGRNSPFGTDGNCATPPPPLGP